GILSAMGPDADDWDQGNFNVLGTNSPLGPKGLVGPLGPLGAVMSLGERMALDASGYVFDRGTQKFVESITIDMPGIDRKYDVFEALSAKYSKELSEKWLLDTSYLADESLKPGEKKRCFRSTAPNNEIVSVVVVPDVSMTLNPANPWFPKRQNFDLEVVTETGKKVVSSRLSEKVNLVQFQVRKGEKFEVRVSPQGNTLFAEPQKFRVVVTGSAPSYAPMVWDDIFGPDFVKLWHSDDKEADVALNYIWADLVAEFFDSYEETLRSGKPPEDPAKFWKTAMAEVMKRYDAIEQGFTAEQLVPALLAKTDEAVSRYRDLLTDTPLDGEQMLQMWRDTMINTPTAKEHDFNLTAEAAGEIPKQWLQWFEQEQKRLKREWL
ncbi:MAG: hypothetical protein HY901_06425, partial [Deltaproteobacteria bacterium]|nr:hypothetical protein [Deltaproteobacteria bacterium]